MITVLKSRSRLARRLGIEPAVAQGAQRRLTRTSRIRAHGAPAQQQTEQPRMTVGERPKLPSQYAQALIPGKRVVGQPQLAEQPLNETIQEVVLVHHMAIQSHRRNVELTCEEPHRQPLEPLTLGYGKRSVEHPIAGQRQRCVRCTHGRSVARPQLKVYGVRK